MKPGIAKLVLYVLGLMVIYLVTEWLVKAIHQLLFQPGNYITYSMPTLHLTKYFALGIALSLIGFAVIQLTPGGKRFFTTLLIACVVGLLITSLTYRAADEERIVKFTAFFKSEYSWDDVEHISTKIQHEDSKRSIGGARSSPRKVLKEYNAHLPEGTVINLWSDLDSVYTLNQITTEKQIQIEHQTEAEYFDQRFTNYFKDEIDKAYSVFGIK